MVTSRERCRRVTIVGEQSERADIIDVGLLSLPFPHPSGGFVEAPTGNRKRKDGAEQKKKAKQAKTAKDEKGKGTQAKGKQAEGGKKGKGGDETADLGE